VADTAAKRMAPGRVVLTRVVPALIVIGAYAVGSWLLFDPLGLLDASHIPAEAPSRCGCFDNGQQVWLLGVAHAQVVAGHLPFFTRAVNYPTGVNLMDTASFPLLAVLAAPLTGLVGPVETLNLLMRLSLVAAATACYLVLRRLGLRTVAAALGGALYGFSPILVRETEAHLFIAFAPLPPVILLIVFRRVAGDVGRPFRGGLLLGVLVVVQGLISIEVLAMTAVVAVAGIAVMGLARLARRQAVGRQAGIAARLAAGTAVIAGPLLAYPVWYLVAGPQHIHGAPSPTGAFALAPLPTLFPNAGTIVAGLWSGWRVEPQGFTDTMGFIGLPMLVVVVWVVGRGRHYGVVVPIALVGLVAWILTLGPRVRIGHGASATRIPLPFAGIDHLPLVQSIVPNRMALFVDLALAVLVAVGADRLLAGAAHQPRPTILIGGAGLLASVALLLPAAAVPIAGVAGAQEFAAASGRRLIPTGAIVLAYPYPRYSTDEAMLWQAESGMRFDLIGGYAERPLTPLDVHVLGDLGVGQNRPGEGTKDAAVLQPRAISRLLHGIGPVPGGLLARAEADLPAFVRDHQVSTAMVDSAAPGARGVITALTAVFGRPAKTGVILIWSHLTTTP
jgi:hypothetical protein